MLQHKVGGRKMNVEKLGVQKSEAEAKSGLMGADGGKRGGRQRHAME